MVRLQQEVFIPTRKRASKELFTMRTNVTPKCQEAKLSKETTNSTGKVLTKDLIRLIKAAPSIKLMQPMFTTLARLPTQDRGTSVTRKTWIRLRIFEEQVLS